MILAGTGPIQVSPEGIPYRVLRYWNDAEGRRQGVSMTETMLWFDGRWCCWNGPPWTRKVPWTRKAGLVG